MNLKELKDYITISRIALTTKCTDPINIQEIRILLQNLRQYLSCRVCHKLPDRLNYYADGFACTLCVNCQITEDTSSATVSTIKQCYMQLCAYIQTSPLYKILCAYNEDKIIVDLVTERNGVSHSINNFKHFVNGVGFPIENEKTDDLNLQVLDVQSPKHKIQNSTILTYYTAPTKKKKERQGCRCGNATKNPGTQTCFGQRCPCYIEQKPCERCECRGCRNPRLKSSNNDDNLDIGKIRRKPVILLSSQNPPYIKNKPA